MKWFFMKNYRQGNLNKSSYDTSFNNILSGTKVGTILLDSKSKWVIKWEMSA